MNLRKQGMSFCVDGKNMKLNNVTLFTNNTFKNGIYMIHLRLVTLINRVGGVLVPSKLNNEHDLQDGR